MRVGAKFITLFADAYVYLCAKVTIIRHFLDDFLNNLRTI
jgi:hypothetical protein